MKLALISDIHGNAIAFQAVLAQLDLDSIDRILCLGDAVATGPQPAECVNLLRQRQIPTIMGNADAWLLDPKPDPDASEFHQFIEAIDLWCRDQLTEADRTFMTSFQPTLEMALSNDHTLLAFHGSPRSFNEILTATTPDETLEELIPAAHSIEGQKSSVLPAWNIPEGVDKSRDKTFLAKYTLMAGGHTHQQLVRRYRDVTLINPGSIGLGYERNRLSGEPRNVPWAEYAILEIDEKQPNDPSFFSIQLCRIPYDVAALKEASLTSGMPQAERWIDGWKEPCP